MPHTEDLASSTSPCRSTDDHEVDVTLLRSVGDTKMRRHMLSRVPA
jgi:hypothetical protein